MPDAVRPNDAERLRPPAEPVEGLLDAMVFHIDAVGRILYASGAACQALGYTEEALTGLRAFDIDTDPDLHATDPAERLALLRSRRGIVRLTEFATADGRRIPVEVSSNFFEFGTNQVIVVVARDLTEHRRSERLMRLMQVSIEESGSALFWLAASGHFFYVNRNACEALGYTQDELLALKVHDIAPDFPSDQWADWWARLKRVGAMTYETRHRRKDGSVFPVELSLNHVEYQGDEFIFGRARDITERVRTAAALRESEERLRQAQKMEAIGRLAGGIAHDFNNLLTAILGYTELVLGDTPDAGTPRTYLTEVRNAAERAAHLTRQLLAFSRKQVVQPTLLDLNVVVGEFERMLSRLIPESVRLVIVPGGDLGRVLADRVQIEQVVMNLAVNARDAMPDGGTLTIETAAVAEVGAGVDDAQGSPTAGEYVRLTVADTGVGMTPEVAAHVFEPFFSTKGGEKGTGLGLATVYGIVRQAGGYVAVRTEEGRGSAFDVYLPRVGATDAGEDRPSDLQPSPEAVNCGDVLVVEDEPLVRGFVCAVLAKRGYHVIEATGPEEALALANRHRQPLDLLVTDLVMPGMNGRDLADRIRVEHPAVATLFMSGYADQVSITEEVLGPGRAFLQKPFTPERIASEVRRLLGERRGRPG